MLHISASLTQAKRIEYIKDYLLTACQQNDYLEQMLLAPNHTLSDCGIYVLHEVYQHSDKLGI